MEVIFYILLSNELDLYKLLTLFLNDEQMQSSIILKFYCSNNPLQIILLY